MNKRFLLVVAALICFAVFTVSCNDSTSEQSKAPVGASTDPFFAESASSAKVPDSSVLPDSPDTPDSSALAAYDDIPNALVCLGARRGDTLTLEIWLCGQVEVFAWDLQLAYHGDAMTVMSAQVGSFAGNAIALHRMDEAGLFRFNSFEEVGGFVNVHIPQKLLTVTFSLKKEAWQEHVSLNFADLYFLDESGEERPAPYTIVITESKGESE